MTQGAALARLREFDLDEALDRAMMVFWERGYEAASLAELLVAMGIARGSLYKAFDDKRAVYLATLDRYDRAHILPGVEMLSDSNGGDGAIRIRQGLLYPAEAVASEQGRRGCFLCNAAVDMSPKDAEVEAVVRAMMDRLKAGFLAALNDAKGAQAMSSAQRRQAAQSLLASYMGLHVLAKAGYNSQDLAGVARHILETLGLAQ